MNLFNSSSRDDCQGMEDVYDFSRKKFLSALTANAFSAASADAQNENINNNKNSSEFRRLRNACNAEKGFHLGF